MSCMYCCVKSCSQMNQKLEAEKQQLCADIHNRRTWLEQVTLSHFMPRCYVLW